MVDDDPDAAETIRRLLEMRGFDVEVLEGAARLLAHVGTNSVDLVADRLPPGGATHTALTLLDRMRMSTDPAIAHVRVIIATDLDENRVFSWQSGVDGFLIRPYHADHLVDELKAVIERSDDERLEHRQEQIRASADDHGQRMAGGAI